jgi:chemotaxis protein MotB
MGNRSAIGAFILTVFMLQACVTDQQQLKNQNTLLQNELKHSQMQLYESEQRIKSLEAELTRLQQAEVHCNHNLAAVKAQNASLQKTNLKLTRRVKQLSSDLVKKKSVIKLQTRVIRLLDDTKKTIETSLKDEIAAQDIELIELEDTLKVVFIDKILFDSGSVKINQKGKTLLLSFAESIRDQNDQNVLVEGHTDAMPLGAALQDRFPSNWELSVARAAAVARFLQDEGKLQPQRLSARGYSFHRPVAPNETVAGRRQNRRIEIILSPTAKSFGAEK